MRRVDTCYAGANVIVVLFYFMDGMSISPWATTATLYPNTNRITNNDVAIIHTTIGNKC